MEVLLILGWIIWLLISLFLVISGVGTLTQTIMRPELRMKRDWPLAILVLVIYTACVLAHPFK